MGITGYRYSGVQCRADGKDRTVEKAYQYTKKIFKVITKISACFIGKRRFFTSIAKAEYSLTFFHNSFIVKKLIFDLLCRLLSF